MSFGDLGARRARDAAAGSGGRRGLAVVVVEARRHARVVVAARDVAADDEAIAQRLTRVLAGALVLESAHRAVLARGDVASVRRGSKTQR
jgi:hypothetical protein